MTDVFVKRGKCHVKTETQGGRHMKEAETEVLQL